jgi:CDP-paratose 2-epimerase
MTRRALITGGVGFIGTNLADRLLSEGRSVVLLDSLSRPGVEKNLTWLVERYSPRVRVVIADIRDRSAIRGALEDISEVYHFAAQVAVTTSLADPATDFEINALGTLNLLEELRAMADPPPLVFTSTNKVYGDLNDMQLVRRGLRYQPSGLGFGIGETRALSFHSPYGCSKGAADQYVLDYARVYGIPATVFRMSCIYGPHQCGTEDQGWLAHFMIRSLDGKVITIYGDGMQVRDVLYVEDLVDALLLAQSNPGRVAGRAFNIGGGPENTTSLLELVDTITELKGARPRVRFEPWRHADQRYYVSDIRAFEAATGWRPGITVQEGAARLYAWLAAPRAMATRLAS